MSEPSLFIVAGAVVAAISSKSPEILALSILPANIEAAAKDSLVTLARVFYFALIVILTKCAEDFMAWLIP